MKKVFIIGLPRTGTTSICVAMLELGYKVAHTAYTDKCMSTAEVIADTPVFCDYQELDKQYPNAKFIYLTRSTELWLPSIKQLLKRMFKNVTRQDGGFNPILKRCFKKIFAREGEGLSIDDIGSDEFLLSCYQRHQQTIEYHFKNRSKDLLSIDISDDTSYQKLIDFLSIDNTAHNERVVSGFIKINVAGKITAWNQVNHPFKIDSNIK